MSKFKFPFSFAAGTKAKAEEVNANFEAAENEINDVLRPGGFETGDLKMTARGAAPDGWLMCDGSAVSRETYADLFAEIGTAHGAGDGATTFNLPSFRDKFPIGVSGTRALGATGGAEKHTLSSSEMPSHSHGTSSITLDDHSHNIPIRQENRHEGTGISYSVMRPEGATGTSSTAWSGGSNPLNGNTDNAGGGGSHNNMPPYRAINFMVKT